MPDQIFDGSFDRFRAVDPPPSGIFNTAQMEASIENYWGDENAEKRFLLPFWKADELMLNSNSSPNRKIALRVTNIEDKEKVDATWVSINPKPDPAYESGSPSVVRLIKRLERWLTTLRNSLTGEPTVTLFVVDDDLYPPGGFANLRAFDPPVNYALIGRIGKKPSGGPEAFIGTTLLTLKFSPGAGGPGATSGMRVPTGL